MENYSGFGVDVRTVMLKKGVRLTALAKEVGISASYLSEILKGTRNGAQYKEKILNILASKL